VRFLTAILTPPAEEWMCECAIMISFDILSSKVICPSHEQPKPNQHHWHINVIMEDNDALDIDWGFNTLCNGTTMTRNSPWLSAQCTCSYWLRQVISWRLQLIRDGCTVMTLNNENKKTVQHARLYFVPLNSSTSSITTLFSFFESSTKLEEFNHGLGIVLSFLSFFHSF
jgi:hypothetical protein